MTAHPVPLERASTELAAWSQSQMALIKEVVAPGCSDEFLRFFAQVCRRRELDPFAGEICAVPRNVKKKDHQGQEYWETHHTIQVTVDGYRSIAERSGLYGGQDQPQWCGQDGVWRDVWLESGPPAAARVAVYRLDWSRPVVGVARYASYVQLGKDGKGNTYPKALWATGPDFMLAKCAEAQALKRAFPRQLAAAGIHVREELSLAQRVAMEARQVGMGDDERHALVAEVTGGRTESSRELTEDEGLATRARLAAIREQAEAMGGPAEEEPPGPPPGVDPSTGERLAAVVDADVVEPRPAAPPPTSPPGPAESPLPGETGAGTGRPYPDQRAAEAWAPERDRERAMPSLRALEQAEAKAPLNAWRRWLNEAGIAQEALRWTGGDLERVVAELKARGHWIEPGPNPADFSEEPF